MLLLAKKIVNLVTDAIKFQWTRHIEPSLTDPDLEPLTEDGLVQDALALATGDVDALKVGQSTEGVLGTVKNAKITRRQ